MLPLDNSSDHIQFAVSRVEWSPCRQATSGCKQQSDLFRIDMLLNVVKINKIHDIRRDLPPPEDRLDSRFPREFGASGWSFRYIDRLIVDSGRVHTCRSRLFKRR